MATKRRLSEKKARMTNDRISDLPVDLKLRILSSLDSKLAVQTTLLSKTWNSLWTRISVLEFNDKIAKLHNLHVFDKLVYRVLHLRDPSAKLDRLTFIRGGISSAKILNTVFDYACSHGVKELEANIDNTRNQTWPICLRSSFMSLKSLNLQSEISIHCPFLGPRSGSFKNLSDLYLRGAIITDPDPFSGFPVLERLTLVNCDIRTEGKTLNLHAPNLLNLTIACYHSFNRCVLTTPRLRCFDYEGSDFPLFRSTDSDLPVLETMVIRYNGVDWDEKRIFDDLLSMFCALPTATSLTLFSPVVRILCFFGDELVNQISPFWKLKCLKVGFEDLQYLFDRPPNGLPLHVKAYLLKNSPDAKVTMIYLPLRIF